MQVPNIQIFVLDIDRTREFTENNYYYLILFAQAKVYF